MASDPREIATKALESLNIDPKTANAKYMAYVMRLAKAAPTTTPDAETKSAAEQPTGYAASSSGRRKVVVIGSIGAG